MSNKLIVLMIDGVSADYFATCRGRLPHFSAIADRGFTVEALHAEVMGTSLPGRTSILTGVTADISGVYGNRIWDGQEFRYANPDDIRVPTLAARAKSAGLDVAVLGFGMIRPEDADIFHPPWWASGFIQRPRDSAPTPADQSWRRAAFHDPGERFRHICLKAGLPTELPQIDNWSEVYHPFFGIVCDQQIMDWVGALAASPDAPDLIIAEFLVTDTFQHYAGYKSDLAHWSVMQADLAIGKIMQRLEGAGQKHNWNFAVLSDHGHSPIETALNPSVILPGVTVQCEGSSLVVAYKNDAELQHITKELTAYQCEPYPNTCIPVEFRDQLAIFMAPPGVSFENDNPEATDPLGRPNAISSHGLRPGSAGDDRFAIFAGPNIPQGSTKEADAVQIAPTLAHILDLNLADYPGSPIFSTLNSNSI